MSRVLTASHRSIDSRNDSRHVTAGTLRDRKSTCDARGWICGATFSRDRVHRYLLWRVWDASRPLLAWVLLNPSTADETREDPTIRRCIRFAMDWGYGGVETTNIFALRSTDPAALRTARDPIGPGNDTALRDLAERHATVVAAWGNHGAWLDRSTRVRELLRRAKTRCLGLTSLAQPRHPLYVRASQALVDF